MELEENVADDLRALPMWMAELGLEDLLNLLGSPSTATANAPRVRVTPNSAPAALGDLVTGSFNKQELSDISFVTEDGTRVYAHKLVLGLTSEVFRTMLTSGLKESISSSAAEIAVMPGISGAAVTIMLRYLYTGTMESLEPALHPATSESCQVICEV